MIPTGAPKRPQRVAQPRNKATVRARNAMGEAARFLAKTMLEARSGCIIWTGATNEKGYGVVSSKGLLEPAHRKAYRWHCGPIGPDEVIRHTCGIKRCVNPDHLLKTPRTGKVPALLPAQSTRSNDRPDSD